jgi:hypothetical protein
LSSRSGAYTPQELLAFPLAALFALELIGTNQGEPDVPTFINFPAREGEDAFG